jgi:phosphoribosylformylglycinamidine cyclo-ligase
VYQVFNCGHRMELYVPRNDSEGIVQFLNHLAFKPKLWSEVVDSDSKKTYTIQSEFGTFEY